MVSSQQSPRPGRQEPVLITEAEPSLAEQHRARKKRYAITMGVRTVALILAGSLYHVIPLWAVLILAVLGTVLPGFAVVMANDRMPKKKLATHQATVPADRQLPDPHRQERTIDG